MKDVAEFAPIKVTIQFHFTDGSRVATADFECPAGDFPSQENLAIAAASALVQVRDAAGEEFEFLDRETFVRDLYEERTGMRDFVVAGSPEWKAAWANKKVED